MNLKIVNKSHNPLPKYQTEGAAGFDLQANLIDPDNLVEMPVKLRPMERAIIPTGLFMVIPEGFEGQIRPRSGLAAKQGVTVLNAPGTIDSDYRGDVGVVLINLSYNEVIINHGDRIAQMVFSKYERAEPESVDVLPETSRGTSGWGHTGK